MVDTLSPLKEVGRLGREPSRPFTFFFFFFLWSKNVGGPTPYISRTVSYTVPKLFTPDNRQGNTYTLIVRRPIFRLYLQDLVPLGPYTSLPSFSFLPVPSCSTLPPYLRIEVFVSILTGASEPCTVGGDSVYRVSEDLLENDVVF